MKLLVDVNDLAWPTSAAPIDVDPSTNEPLCIALDDKVRESARGTMTGVPPGAAAPPAARTAIKVYVE